MTNRIERGIGAWHKRQEQYARVFGDQALNSRTFAKIRLEEMQKLYRQNNPPRNLDERVSLKMLRSANRNLERRIYPNRIFRMTRRFLLSSQRLVGGLLRDNPGQFQDIAVRQIQREKPAMQIAQKTQQQIAKPRVVRMPSRKHAPLAEDIKKSKGISR